MRNTDDTDDHGRCTQPENRTGGLHNHATDRSLKHFKRGRHSDRGINDTAENIFGFLEACQKASVRGIMTFHSFGVTLRDGDRQYFYSQLDKKFPGLRRAYIETYGNAYELPIPRDREVFPVFREKCEAAGISGRITFPDIPA